ncbi:FAM32A-like-like protein [Drosera capensis]
MREGMSAYDNVVVGKLKLKGKALDVKSAGVKKKKHKKYDGVSQIKDSQKLEGASACGIFLLRPVCCVVWWGINPTFGRDFSGMVVVVANELGELDDGPGDSSQFCSWLVNYAKVCIWFLFLPEWILGNCIPFSSSRKLHGSLGYDVLLEVECGSADISADTNEEFETLTEEGKAPHIDDHLTPAERRYIEQRQKLDVQWLAKKANKSHRDRIEQFNQSLANMSEHYDIPKVGPG